MKLSQFNVKNNHEGKILYYNSLSNNFLVLEPLLYDLLQAANDENNLKGLEEVHPDFYDELIKHEYIVEEGVDEVKKVKELSKSIDDDRTFYRLIINPTMNCNFKCWYCYESHIKGSKMKEKDLNKVKKFIDNTIKTNQDLESYAISWFGGEPMLYYKDVILPILKYTKPLLDEKGISLTSDFTTNGFLIKESMIKEFKEYNMNFFQITLDGDREKHNTVRYVSKTRGSYDEIINNIKLLCHHGIDVRLRINYTEDVLNKIENILVDLATFSKSERDYLKIGFHQVWQDKKNLSSKLSPILDNFRKHGLIVTTHEAPDNVRNSCYADKLNHATINYNGEVFKCTARDFTSDNKEGELNDDGTVTWNATYHKRRNSKFKNKPCLSCSILPICNGGCSQHAMENEGKDYCVYNFDENKKKDVVLNKFLEEVYN